MNCLASKTLLAPACRFCRQHVIEARRGQRIVRAIGFEAGEERRTYAHVVKAIGLDAGEEHRQTWMPPTQVKGKRLSREQWLDQHYFVYWYPLLAWGHDRERCKRIIAQAGLPIPVKSAC